MSKFVQLTHHTESVNVPVNSTTLTHLNYVDNGGGNMYPSLFSVLSASLHDLSAQTLIHDLSKLVCSNFSINYPFSSFHSVIEKLKALSELFNYRKSLTLMQKTSLHHVFLVITP